MRTIVSMIYIYIHTQYIHHVSMAELPCSMYLHQGHAGPQLQSQVILSQLCRDTTVLETIVDFENMPRKLQE